MQEDPEQTIKLDNNVYDFLVIGTGLEDTMYCAHLAKIAKKKLLVVDFEKTYSRNTRTMNFKEFHQFTTNLPPNHPYPNKPFLQKEEIFFKTPVTTLFNELNEVTAQHINSTTDFKYFNIDTQPKLLYSTSSSVELMQQADMDQYMDFRAIVAQYYFENKANRFITTPLSKSEIFMSKLLSLQEKKQMFQLLHSLMSLANHVFKRHVDMNSTEEFDKVKDVEPQVIALYEELKDQQAQLFISRLLNNALNPESTKRLTNIYICALGFASDQSLIKTSEFLSRLAKFMKSLGVHTSNAFLYTNYGTGDIAQGFSRVAAVYGSDFILGENVRIKSFEWLPEKVNVKTNLTNEGSDLEIRDGVLISHDFKRSYRCLMGMNSEVVKSSLLLRMMVVATKSPQKLPVDQATAVLKFNEFDVISPDAKKAQSPTLFIIPPESQILNQKYPMYVMRTDNNSNSTHRNYEIFYIKVKIDEQDESIKLVNDCIGLIQRVDLDYLDNEESRSFNFVCYVSAFIQKGVDEQSEFQDDKDVPVYFTSPESSDIDFDNLSDNFKANIKILNNNLDEGYYMVQHPDKVALGIVEQNSSVNDILNQLQLLS